MKKINLNSIKRAIRNLGRCINKHSPEILTAAGIAGGITTVVLVAKEAPLVKEELDILHEDLAEQDEELTKSQIIWEEAKVAIPHYAPAIVTGAASVGCILGSYKVSTKRTAAFATAYELANRNLIEYKDKAKKMLGDTKKEKLEASIAQDKVNNNPPKDNEVIITDGECLFYDSVSGRYFRSSVDKIRKAEARLNKMLIQEMYVSLNDLYSELDIPCTKIGNDIGWNVDELIDIYFNSIVAPGDIPCLVMDYMVAPRYDYTKLM